MAGITNTVSKHKSAGLEAHYCDALLKAYNSAQLDIERIRLTVCRYPAMRDRRLALEELRNLLHWAAAHISSTDEPVSEEFRKDADRLLEELTLKRWTRRY